MQWGGFGEMKFQLSYVDTQIWKSQLVEDSCRLSYCLRYFYLFIYFNTVHCILSTLTLFPLVEKTESEYAYMGSFGFLSVVC